MTSIPQQDDAVKDECIKCHEPTFRNSGLCFAHFAEEQNAEWDAQDAERETCSQGVGYVFSDHIPMEVY